MIYTLKNTFYNKLSLLITGLSLISTFAIAQPGKVVETRAELIHRIDSILQSQVNDGKIPGAVIQIKQGDNVIYKQAYGYAQKFNYEHEPLAVPDRMTTGHLFDIASLTKVVGTTTSIMLLADHGLLNINDPVSKYIKAFINCN